MKFNIINGRTSSYQGKDVGLTEKSHLDRGMFLVEVEYNGEVKYAPFFPHEGEAAIEGIVGKLKEEFLAEEPLT